MSKLGYEHCCRSRGLKIKDVHPKDDIAKLAAMAIIVKVVGLNVETWWNEADDGSGFPSNSMPAGRALSGCQYSIVHA